MLSLYISRTTWLHKVPAAPKLALLALGSVLLLGTESLSLLLVAQACALAGFIGLGPPGRTRLKDLIKTAGLLAALVGLVQFLILVDLDALTSTWLSSIRLAAIATLRLLVLIMLADLISITTPLADMLRVLQVLLSPLRLIGIQPSTVRLAVGLVSRFASLLRGRWQVVDDALRLHGVGQPGLRVVPPLARHMSTVGIQLAESLQSRRLRTAEQP